MEKSTFERNFWKGDRILPRAGLAKSWAQIQTLSFNDYMSFGEFRNHEAAPCLVYSSMEFLSCRAAVRINDLHNPVIPGADMW